MKLPPAVVIKLDSISGLSIARILSGHKIPVIGIADDPGHFSCRTNSCEDIIHSDTSGGELLETLLRLAPKFPVKPVLFMCSDESVRVLSDNRERLGEFYSFVIPDADVLDLYMNKQNFYRYALDSDFPIPATFYPTDKPDLEEVINRDLFPYIVKPVNKTRNWFKYFKNKAVTVKNRQELCDVFEKSSRTGENIIVQEWINGSDSDLYSCIFYYDRNNNKSITFTSRKLRQWYIENGDASLAEECRNDDVLNITLDLLSRVKFSGIGSVEFKLDNSTGRYFIIEPNIGRPVSRIGLVEASGVPIIYAMYRDASGSPLPADTVQRYAGMKWIAVYLDVRSSWAYFREGKLTLRGWLKSLSGPISIADFSVRDPLPFMAIIYMGFFVQVKNLWRTVRSNVAG